MSRVSKAVDYDMYLSPSLFEERRRRQSAESEKKFKSKRFTFPGRKKFLKRKDDSLPHSVSLSHTHTHKSTRSSSPPYIYLSIAEDNNTRAHTMPIFVSSSFLNNLFSKNELRLFRVSLTEFVRLAARRLHTKRARANKEREHNTKQHTNRYTRKRINNKWASARTRATL